MKFHAILTDNNFSITLGLVYWQLSLSGGSGLRHVVIMAGGKGTRFWPLSRARTPKQFLKLIGQQTLIEQTIKRVIGLVSQDRIWIVISKGQDALVKPLKKTYPKLNLLVEPIGKDTLPCIGWAASCLVKKDPSATMIVCPADHFITPKTKFITTLRKAANHAEFQDCIVTIGIKPTHPHTGYGYIQTQTRTTIREVLRFKEKPNLKTATTYLKAKTYLWNSGIFVWKAAFILKMLQKTSPKHSQLLDKISTAKQEQMTQLYKQFEPISIDYGLLEKHPCPIWVLVADFTWDDLGSWDGINPYWPTDENQNARIGKITTVDAKNNLVYAPQKHVGLVGIEDTIVVDTPDALLVMKKSSAQSVKSLVPKLPKSLQ